MFKECVFTKGKTKGRTSGGGVDGHVVGGVVKELGTRVALNIVGVVVAPAQLHIHPVLVAGLLVHHIVRVRHQAARTTTQDVSTSNMHHDCRAKMACFSQHESVAAFEHGCWEGAPGLGHGPSVSGKEQNVRAGRVHFVRLARVDGLLLHSLNLQRIQLLVEDLAPV